MADGGFGTEAGGTPAKEWCKLCYENGAFKESELTVADMMKRSMRNMTHDLKMSDEQAEVMATSVIPTLKRWRNPKAAHDPSLNPKP